MTKRFGFTLAEVLITLGIIGVVAAMTIPTLIANTNSAKFRSQFKKTLSTLNQAALMAQAQYDINYSDVKATCKSGNDQVSEGKVDDADTDATICAIMNDVLSGPKYIANPFDVTVKGTEKYKINDGSASGVTLTGYQAYELADGSLFAFKVEDKYCTKSSPCTGFIDVNGKSRPNKLVSCNNPDYNTNGALTCAVNPDSEHMTDVYPVIFHDGEVEPASAAARSVLTASNNDSAVEAGGAMGVQGIDYCDIKVNGCSPCAPCYEKGFNLQGLQEKAGSVGVRVNLAP